MGKHAEACSRVFGTLSPGAGSAGLITLRESRVNAAGSNVTVGARLLHFAPLWLVDKKNSLIGLVSNRGTISSRTIDRSKLYSDTRV